MASSGREKVASRLASKRKSGDTATQFLKATEVGAREGAIEGAREGEAEWEQKNDQAGEDLLG